MLETFIDLSWKLNEVLVRKYSLLVKRLASAISIFDPFFQLLKIIPYP